MATDYANLVPRDVADRFLSQIEVQSVALRLGNSLRMNVATESIPVVSFLPIAGFVNPRYGGQKPATKVEWSALQLVPEEIAAVVPVPTAWIQDAGFDVEGQVEAALGTAVAKAIDLAVLFGEGAPASYPVGGVAAAAGAAVAGTDALDALSNGMAQVEASGLVPDGIASGPAIGAALRAEYRAIAQLPSEAPQNSIYGLPVAVSPVWDSTKGDAIVGDWNFLAIGVREDITFAQTDTGVLQDAAGDIIANMFQDNLTAVKIWARIAIAIGSPLAPDGSGPAHAFALTDWTP